MSEGIELIKTDSINTENKIQETKRSKKCNASYICAAICVFVCAAIIGVIIWWSIDWPFNNHCCPKNSAYCCELGYPDGAIFEDSLFGCTICCANYPCSGWNYYQFDSFLFNKNHSDIICGDLLTNITASNWSNCCNLCVKQIDDQLYFRYTMVIAFYVEQTSECYCEIKDISNFDLNNSIHSLSLYDLCSLNGSYFVSNVSVEQYWIEYWDTPAGRPYIVDSGDIKVNIREIDCQQYEFYINNLQLFDKVNLKQYMEYIQQAKAEYISVATFNKFSLELMNIGSPLEFIKLTQQAVIDEINHTKIMFDVVNAIRLSFNVNDSCLMYDTLPYHTISLHKDWNSVALDVVDGGCFGETQSVMNMVQKLESQLVNYLNNEMKQKMYQIALDEARHSALAWTVAKWIIYNNNTVDIADYQWWEYRLHDKSILVNDIFELFWNFETETNHGNSYMYLYQTVLERIQSKMENSLNRQTRFQFPGNKCDV
eukprot:433546_1